MAQYYIAENIENELLQLETTDVMTIGPGSA
jgi:hypothetical protein